LALKGRVQKITAVQNANVLSLCLQLSNYSYDAAESASVALLYCADPVGIVQVNKCQARGTTRGGLRRNARDEKNAGHYKRYSFHGLVPDYWPTC
jgi:hypothetical protein